ncbi:tRNA (N6-isopentenyl adenosine(37)-C2)-methylthiotransferase MiaB [Treponema sp. HNW]|uniref:tRNA (N6-isopentenyl adenosine(37)-C2)-methylthiotransferase MiaB n=1 Tax=Treponema sp. HNW TaxID=3116654 RepID=UPI003D0B77F2
MTFFFETYGCQMNKAESSAVEQLLLARGWTASPGEETADLIIINTCSVRETAESRIRGRLGRYTALRKQREKSGKPPFVLTVTGCMAERLKDKLQKDFPVVDYVVGNFEKKRYADIAFSMEARKGTASLLLSPKTQDANASAIKIVQSAKAEEEKSPPEVRSAEEFSGTVNPGSRDFPDKPVYSFAPLSLEPGAFQAFVPIMHGCNNFCTYCIVPYVRGREISRPVEEILKELDMLSERNVREITLLGQNVNSYRHAEQTGHSEQGGQTKKGGTVDFPELLERIASHLQKTSSSIEWVRFMSSHPKDFSDELIRVIRDYPVICRHIHLPVQHGSSRILQKMNRRYSRETYLDLVTRIRAELPDVSLTSDILIGFPGETEDDFEQTLSLMEQVRYEAAFMYYYNPREGTPACTYPDQVPLEEKKRRLDKIIRVQQRITKEEITKRLGTTVKVLAESPSRDNKAELLGHTEQDGRVVFAADESVTGSFVRVRLESIQGNTFRGTRVG